MEEKNHYDFFEINKEATTLEIKQAFKKMSMRFPNETHPDQFLEIKDIYELLMNPEQRKIYDEDLTLGKANLGLIQDLEEKIRYDFEQVDWRTVKRLEPVLLKSERAANVMLEATLLLGYTKEGADYGRKLKQHNRLTKNLRLLFAYLLRREKLYEEAIRELKILSFEEDETNLETLTLYGELLMLAELRNESMDRYERWIMKHPDKRTILWKSWVESVVFWGQKEQLKVVMSWMSNRFTETEKEQAQVDLTNILDRAIEYRRFDSAYFLMESHHVETSLHLSEKIITEIKEMGGVMEELTMAHEAKNIPFDFLFPVHEWIEYLKSDQEEEDPDEFYSSLDYLYNWLSQSQTNKALVSKFCLLYPKSYGYLQEEYDEIFHRVGWAG